MCVGAQQVGRVDLPLLTPALIRRSPPRLCDFNNPVSTTLQTRTAQVNKITFNSIAPVGLLHKCDSYSTL